MTDENKTDEERERIAADMAALLSQLPDGTTIRLKDLPCWPELRENMLKVIEEQINRMRAEGDMSYLEPGWDPFPPDITRF